MRYLKHTLTLLFFMVVCMFFVTCKKDKNLPRVSFPEVTNINADPVSKTKATITFNLGGDLVDNDPVVEMKICYNEQGSSEIMTKDISSDQNFVILENLSAKTDYEYTIKVLTAEREKDEGEWFVFEGLSFPTTSIEVVLDTNNIVEIEQDVTLSANGIIKDFNEINPDDIETFGHRWTFQDNGNTVVRITSYTDTDEEQISTEGIFTSVLRLADFTKDIYKVEAFVKLRSDVDTTFTMPPFPYKLKSKGNFWAKVSDKTSLSDLEYFFDENNHKAIVDNTFEDVFGDISGLIGGVSFVRNGEAYIGLGNNNGQYPTKFYQYDAILNKWVEADINFPLGAEGRMFAVSFVDEVTNDVYIGSGCRNCDDYYQFCDDPTSTQLVDGITFYNDLYKLENNSNEFVLQPQGNNPITDRFAGYGFYSGKPYIGGGISKKYKGDKNGNGIIDEGEWIDGFNEDGANGMMDSGNVCYDIADDPEFGEWVDDGDVGEFNSGEWNWMGNNDKIFDTGEWVDNGDGVFDTDEWIDDGDGVFDTGEWVDNGDGIFDTGEWIDNGDGVFGIDDMVGNQQVTNMNFDNFYNNNDGILFNSGEWNWSMANGGNDDLVFDSGEWNWSMTNGGNGDLIFNSGEWNWGMADGGNGDLVFDSGEWDWKSDTNDDTKFIFDGGDWDPTLIPTAPFEVVYSEWYDVPPCNGIVDGGEVHFTLGVDSSLYNYNSAQWNPPLLLETNQRLGARIWQINTNTSSDIFMVGGNSEALGQASPTDPYIFEFNSTSWSPENSSTSFATRNFPYSFVINNKGYVGAGETNTGDIVAPDLWEFNPNVSSEKFKNRNCGIPPLTRSVSFSLKNKGYVGFGKTTIGSGTNLKEFWMYVPCRDDNNCN